MTSIDGIELFPVISLTIFVAFFIGLFVWVIRMKKKDVKELSDYPLND
jgi:hypothetical protein